MLSLLLLTCLPATDLVVSNGSVQTTTGIPELEMRVSWKNAWRNTRNHDAAWVFVKIRALPNGPWRHANLAPDGHRGPTQVTLTVAPERTGFFVASASTHRGSIEAPIVARLNPAVFSGMPVGSKVEARVFGIEMVSIPEGPFHLGDISEGALAHNSYFQSSAGGVPAETFPVVSEDKLIDVGPGAGQLFYRVNQPQYQGDQKGPIPVEFPKGVRGIFMMKYELTQGQYADFLNHISPDASNFRAVHGGTKYASQRGSIALQGGQYVATAPNRPANWVSWNDSMAFADWAALRPMTEFEYTKACRGPDVPAAGDFPWGTISKEGVARQIAAPVDDLTLRTAEEEAQLSDATRVRFGASYYWVLDLAGSVWERVVSPAHPSGRAFRGTHGDGRITAYGSATNEDWPKGDEEPGGYGYRGGGYYEHGFNAGEFNPHSRTEWRRFGAWGQGPRSVAYGFRAVRTAP